MTESEIEELRQSLVVDYPELVLTRNYDGVAIRGSFPILHDGEFLDRFLIEVQVPRKFPAVIPTLREIGGRIPPTADRHTNSNGESCPLVPEEWLLLPTEQRTILNFLNGPVRNFLLFQVFKERGLDWPWGERAHGRAGLIEAYGEMLDVDAEMNVPKCLAYVASKKIKGHWLCPCGSGRRLRDCHLPLIREAQAKIPRGIAESALKRLRDMK